MSAHFIYLKKLSDLWSKFFGPEGEGPGALCVFIFSWVLLMCLYWPARKAGFVTDFTGWLDQVRNHGFWDFINRTNFQAKSWYQLTQFNTWSFYKVFGVHAIAWHLLFVTLHATNAWLLYMLCRGLLNDSGVKNGGAIAAVGVLFFCVTPYISEVIVWEPAFHFLQGLLLLLAALVLVQRSLQTGSKRYAFFASLAYLLSLFSLEIFYITPWLVLSMGFFYQNDRKAGQVNLKLVLKYFFTPMLILFVLRMAGYRIAYGDWVSRIGSGSVSAVQPDWFGKPAKYLFHLLLMGRFWSEDLRHTVYDFCDSKAGLILFYGVVVGFLAWIFSAFGRMSGKARVASLLYLWMMMALLLLVPLWFATDLLVVYDRYTYFAGAYFYMLVAVLGSMIAMRWIRLGLLGVFLAVNVRYNVKVVRYWSKSYRIVNSLLLNLPDDRSKTMLLFNLPQNLHGIPMIGAEKNSEFKLMHDLLIPDKLLTNTVYDVMAYNMLTPQDGAHVEVINDSMIKVTLNQWGTWWWMETRGGYSYWTSDYKLDLKDPGHWYELTLRKPADQYILLYNVGEEWRRVEIPPATKVKH